MEEEIVMIGMTEMVQKAEEVGETWVEDPEEVGVEIRVDLTTTEVGSMITEVEVDIGAATEVAKVVTKMSPKTG